MLCAKSGGGVGGLEGWVCIAIVKSEQVVQGAVLGKLWVSARVYGGNRRMATGGAVYISSLATDAC